MKKHVKKNRNKKGSVLLTVVCFTLVCMIIATTALSLAAYATKNSNHNVRSTQAEITAEDYLKEFLKTFNDNYDSLQSMANVGANVNVAISTGAPNIGDCNINVKKKSGGILVTSTVNYAGKTESVSAFFSGSAPSNFDSTNVIETNEGISGNDKALVCEGDALIEDTSGSTNKLVYFHNSQSKITGNYITQCSLIAGYNTNTEITKTVDDKAPIVIANGYLFWGQTKINSGDKVKSKSSTGFYNNTDGYVLTNSKFIALGNRQNGQIGESGKPIDVYCYGAWFGKVTDADITNVYRSGALHDDFQAGPCPKIYGNMYCYKCASALQDGNFYVNCNNENDAYIDGDLIVEGNIYLKSKLVVNGTLYCKGTIFKMNSDGNVDNTSGVVINSDGRLSSTCSDLAVSGGYSNTLPSDERAQMPTIYTSTSNFTNQYKTAATPNQMYQQSDTNPKAKGIKAKYADAYGNSDDINDIKDKVLGSTFIDDRYSTSLKDIIDSCSDMNEVRNYLQNNNYFTLYAKGNYYLKKDVLAACYNQFDNKVKIQIEVENDDIVVILPNGSTNMDIAVKYTGSKNSENVPVNFCYFMLDCGKDARYYAVDNYPYLSSDNNQWDFTETSIYNITQFSGGAVAVRDAVATKNKANNNFILIPDGCEVKMKAQNATCIQAVIYGPQASLNVTGTGGSQRVFLGQAFVKSFETNQNDARVASQLAAEGSILEFISSISSSSAIKLQYFTKKSN